MYYNESNIDIEPKKKVHKLVPRIVKRIFLNVVYGHSTWEQETKRFAPGKKKALANKCSFPFGTYCVVCYGKKADYLRHYCEKCAEEDRVSYDWVRQPQYTIPPCRYCMNAVEERNAEIVSQYWGSSKYYFAHKDCVKEGMKKEAYECQLIDTDCNDCINYTREKTLEPNVSIGQCNKYNKEVVAHVNFSTEHDCFVHRRAASM